MKNGYSNWRKLDNAALAFPLVTGKNDTRVFRFYCELNENVDPKLLQDALDKTMEKYPEINTRQAIQAYFKRLLMERGDDMLDQKKILNLERSCMFKQTEREFRLIDEDTRTVYIPNRENAADLARLRAGQYSKTLFRRLARSSVNIYQKEYLKLVSAAAVEDFDDFGILIRQDQYNTQCGLSVDAEDGLLMI